MGNNLGFMEYKHRTSEEIRTGRILMDFQVCKKMIFTDPGLKPGLIFLFYFIFLKRSWTISCRNFHQSSIGFISTGFGGAGNTTKTWCDKWWTNSDQPCCKINKYSMWNLWFLWWKHPIYWKKKSWRGPWGKGALVGKELLPWERCRAARDCSKMCWVLNKILYSSWFLSLLLGFSPPPWWQMLFWQLEELSELPASPGSWVLFGNIHLWNG